MSSHATIHPSAQVHPRAMIDPSAVIEEGAVVEADAFVGPKCVIGPRTRLRVRSIIVEHTTLGAENDVHPGAVLGGDPQDRAFKGDIRGELIIGDRNIFREGVTISRATHNGPPTRIGSGCMFMTISHAGHNAQVGDNCILANGACLAGHARLGSGVVMSAYCAVHQFTTIGDGVMFQGGGMVGMHVPPFVVVAIGKNTVAGLNRVGMRRNPALTPSDRVEVKEAFRAIYRLRSGETLAAVIEELLKRPWGPAATKFVEFCRDALKEPAPRARGLCGGVKAARLARSEEAEGD